MHKSNNPRLVPQTFCAPSISAMPGMFNQAFQLLLDHYYLVSTGKKAQRSSAWFNTYRSIPLQRIQVPILILTLSPVRAKTMMLARMNMPTAPLKGVALQNKSLYHTEDSKFSNAGQCSLPSQAATMQAMLPAGNITHLTTHAGVVAVNTIICYQKVHTLATFITVMQNRSTEVTKSTTLSKLRCIKA